MNVWHDFISLFVPAADDHKMGFGTKPAVKSIERVIHSKKVSSILAPAIFNTWL
jgi:hypothetical protein